MKETETSDESNNKENSMMKVIEASVDGGNEARIKESEFGFETI
ncbi:hypothetical protein A2U01_0105804, partial [Trifolium medium]|nr:hypothetical protein [Trifolium medium]